MKRNKGFTMIELLTVALVMGILSATAVPAYTMSLKQSRQVAANQGARSIIKAVQGLYVKANGASYLHKTINANSIERELGQWPSNPCTGGNTVADYIITRTATSTTVQAKAGANCLRTELPAYTVGRNSIHGRR